MFSILVHRFFVLWELPAALCGDQPTITADNQQISVAYLEYASKDAPPFSFHKQSLAYRYSALIRYRMLCTSEPVTR